MIAQVSKPHTYTVEEYFELELASETRSEYRNGEIIPMTGGTHITLSFSVFDFQMFTP